MIKHSVEITPGMPGEARIAIDGRDISRAVRRAVLDMDVDKVIPELHLDLLHFEAPRFETAEAEVVIATPTREVLIALGWTPPPEEE